MKKKSAIILVLLTLLMFMVGIANAQTSTLPLTSGDLFKAYDNYQKGIYAKAFETFKSLSDNGDMHATYGLGVCYYNGRGTTKNLQEAFNCFDRSYNSGNKSAAFIIGKCFFYGQGVEKNFDKAKKYLTEASNQGNMEAKTLLTKIDAAIVAEMKKLSAGVTYVDLGLYTGTLWADRNIGAASPEDYGCYFAWGETTPKSNYDWTSYKYANGGEMHLTKYCNKSICGYGGYTDRRNILERTDDAATVNWGSSWCMPTGLQIEELYHECTWTLTTRNGVEGYEVKGPNGNSIFLPCAGVRHGEEFSDGGCCYWSSLLFVGNPGGGVIFWLPRIKNELESAERSMGLPIRPIRRNPDLNYSN